MRAFIAIELPKEIKDYLGKLQNQLKTSGADIKWVEPQNIHLTLKFLGEIDDVLLAKINEIIQAAASGRNEFYMRLTEVGAFPSISSPKVIWVGIDEGDKEVKGIAAELEENIAKIGMPKESRAFSSHITIGRSKSALNQVKLLQLLKELAGKPAEENLRFAVKKIFLFKSTLTPKGPVYEILKNVNLKTN